MSSRRRILAALTAGIASSVTGCIDMGGGSGGGGGGETTTTTAETTTATTTTTAETTTAETTTATTTTTSVPTDYTIEGTYPTYMATAGRTGDLGDTDHPQRGLSKEWETFLDEQGSGPFVPVLAGNRLYAAGGDVVARVNPTSGKREWRTEFDTHAQSPPTVGGGRVFATSRSGLYALDAETGDQFWKAKDVQTYSGGVTPPIYLNGTVYLVSSSVLYAIDAEDGSVQWTGGPRGAPGEVALGAGKAFVGSNDGSGGIEAFSLADGREVWTQSLPGGQPCYPRVRGGVVYSTAKPRQQIPKVFAYAHDGTKRWDHTLENPGLEDSRITALAVGEDQVLASDDAGNLHSLSPQDGSENWQNTLGEGKYYQLTVAGDRIYAVNQVNNLVVFSAEDGSTLFQQRLPGGCFVPPVVNNQAVYVAKKDYLYAFA